MVDKDLSIIMGAVLAVAIAGILIGYVFPIGLDAMNTQPTNNITQDVNQDYTVTAEVVSNVTGVSSSGANITLNDTETTESASYTDVSAGTNKTVNWQGGTITLEVISVDTSEDTATVKYDYPSDYGWSDGESSLYDILPIFVVLVPLGVLAGLVMRSM